jgi:hypothetical protein
LMTVFIWGKKIRLHGKFDGSVWTGQNLKTERVVEEGFDFRSRFVGDRATGRAAVATYALGLDYCPPRFLITIASRKLIYTTSNKKNIY